MKTKYKVRLVRSNESNVRVVHDHQWYSLVLVRKTTSFVHYEYGLVSYLYFVITGNTVIEFSGSESRLYWFSIHGAQR